MKPIFSRATLTAALLAGSGAMLATAAHAADAPKEPKMTASINKLLFAAQTAAQKKDYTTAMDDIHQAQANTDATPFDTYKINQFLTFVAVNAGDEAAADTAAEAAADSPAMPDADKIGVTKNALILSIQAKHYPKAMTYAKTLIDSGADKTDKTIVAAALQAYYLGGDYAQAQALGQKEMDATPPGQMMDRNTAQILLSSQVKLKDEAGAEKTLEALAISDNDPADWAQVVDIAFTSKGLRDIDAIYLGRLLMLVGGTVSEGDANIIATTASKLTFYGDMKAAVAKGATPIPESVAKEAADEKSLPAQLAAAPKQGGQYNVKLAQALYGYGRYADAEATARAAIAKGGAADPGEPQMVLGMTLVAEQKYADAIQAFGQVTGGSPAMPRIVRLWKGYAQDQLTPPGAAASAAPAPAAAAK